MQTFLGLEYITYKQLNLLLWKPWVNLLKSSVNTSSVRLGACLDGVTGGAGVSFFGSSTGVSAGTCVPLAGVGGGGIRYRLHEYKYGNIICFCLILKLL